ncbi:hypothetical protein CF326_g2623 [Tilletia indica]|nr:hypothetical protein CF326_g2623 [Tilletia indica]
MPSSSSSSAHRSGSGSGRTYGSKPSGAHRIMRTQMAPNWLEEPASSSSFYASRDRPERTASADADPLHLHDNKKAAVELAADSSSSADGGSPRRSSMSGSDEVRPSRRVVEETPSPSPTTANTATLALSDGEDEDEDEVMPPVDTVMEPSASPPAPERQTPSRLHSLSPAADSEESEFESPRANKDISALRLGGPSANPRVSNASSKPRALLEVLIPQPKQTPKPAPRLNGSAISKPTPSERSRPSTRSQSPMRTTNGARPTEALAEVIRRSKRERKHENYDELSDEAESTKTPSRPTRSSREPRMASTSATATASTSRLRRSTSLSSRATSEATETGRAANQKQKTDQLDANMKSLRSLALEPGRVPRKSHSLVAIDIPMWTSTPERPRRPALCLLPDEDRTPRPEIRKLRSSLGRMPSSDPDSLKGAHGSSPFKRRRTTLRQADDEDSSEDEDEESEEESDDDEDDTLQVEAGTKGAASLEMSKKDHSIILGPDLKSVDENMTTLLAACSQKTFIPFSKILGLLGAGPAPKKTKKGPKSASSEAGTLVKIGEATYSEVFRLTTTVSMRSALGYKNGSKLAGSESWEERKVLKIVPIRKDKPAQTERKAILPSAVAAARSNTKTPEKEEADDGSSRRRGARARAPTVKRGDTNRSGSDELLQRKRARERVSTGPELSTARDVQREIEITRALGSLNPDGGAGGAFGSFVKLHAAHIVAGKYPKRLLDAWDEYHDNKEGGSENWRPDVLEDNQIFAVIVLGDGGRNLEHSELQTWQQAASIFWQLVHAIATAEMAIQFEHRDLHWGNVLISPRPPEIEPLRSATLKSHPSALSVLASPRTAAKQAPSLMSASSTVNFLNRAAERGRKVLNVESGSSTRRRNGSDNESVPTKGLSSSSSEFSKALEAQNAGVYATIIDFALSRVVLEPGEGIRRNDAQDGVDVRQKRILAYDFDDEEIFEGKGDAQFDVYRDMRDLVEGDWHTFRPVTNVMWLSFFVEKLTATRKLKQLDSRPGKNYVGDEHRERYFYFFLRHCQRRIHSSVEDVLEAAFDVRDAKAKAERLGRPIEEFLPQKEAKGSSKGKGGKTDAEEKASPKPLVSAKSLLRWMRREVERLGDGFHAGDV